MEIYTQFKRPEKKFEKKSGPSKVDIAGYRNQNLRIEDLINAGARLVDWRRAQFDFNEGDEIDEDFIDPTRNKGFDMEDASVLQRLVEESIMLTAQEKKASQIVQEASGKPQKEQIVQTDEKPE